MNSCDPGEIISMRFASAKEQSCEGNCDNQRGEFQNTNISLSTSTFPHPNTFLSGSEDIEESQASTSYGGRDLSNGSRNWKDNTATDNKHRAISEASKNIDNLTQIGI